MSHAPPAPPAGPPAVATVVATVAGPVADRSRRAADRMVEQRRNLRMMKARASGLLLFAAVVLVATYLLTKHGDAGWVGFVRAGAEAAMVGGFADWFAVTALFRRPLGLPIPHTALIPRRKDELGRTLGAFMQENFLSAPVVAARLRAMTVVTRVGSWFAQPAHAGRVTAELADSLHLLLVEVRRDDLPDVLAEKVVQRFAGMTYAPIAGRLLAGLVKDGAHQEFVDITVRQTRRWLSDNPDLIVRNLKRPVPGFVPWFVKDPVVERLYDNAIAVATEIERDPQHELRRSLDRLLLDYAADLQEDGVVSRSFDELLQAVLRNPETSAVLGEVLDRLLTVVSDLADEPDGELRAAVTDQLVRLGVRARDDVEVNGRLEALLERLLVHVTQTYADVFIRFITDTVADWDAAEATQRIELNVGRDLQFIRINGTVVGAIAGLAIHAVTLLLG